MPSSFDHANPVESFKGLLVGLLKGYTFDVVGLHLKDGSVRPLPSDTALIGRIFGVSIKEYLRRKLVYYRGLKLLAGGARSYPAMTFDGPDIGHSRFAVEIKCALLAEGGNRTRCAIRIANSYSQYFRYPDRKAPKNLIPYQDYTGHFAIIALYDFLEGAVQQRELLVVEKWRVATRGRAGGTGCRIGAVSNLDRLRAEQGDFGSEEAFNAYWRGQRAESVGQTRTSAGSVEN